MVDVPSNFNGTRVEAIPGTPLPHGLLNAATLLDVSDTHEMNGVQWQPMSCAEVLQTYQCPPEGVDPAEDKVFTNSGTTYAPPVTLYYGRSCPPMGEAYDEAVAYVKAGLAIGEQAALEAWTWDTLLQPDADDVTPTPGTPVTIREGLGLLEGALGSAYGGVGVIHVPLLAGAAVTGDGHVLVNGARLDTWVGNHVSLGAGYSNTKPGVTPTPAPAGQAWLYASGPVIIRRETVDVPGSADSDHINITLNDRDLLAERTWVVGVECAVKAVLVRLAEQ